MHAGRNPSQNEFWKSQKSISVSLCFSGNEAGNQVQFLRAEVQFSVSNPVFSGSVSHVIPITIQNSCIVWCWPSVWAMADSLGKPMLMGAQLLSVGKVIGGASHFSSCPEAFSEEPSVSCAYLCCRHASESCIPWLPDLQLYCTMAQCLPPTGVLWQLLKKMLYSIVNNSKEGCYLTTKISIHPQAQLYFILFFQS